MCPVIQLYRLSFKCNTLSSTVTPLTSLLKTNKLSLKRVLVSHATDRTFLNST